MPAITARFSRLREFSCPLQGHSENVRRRRCRRPSARIRGSGASSRRRRQDRIRHGRGLFYRLNPAAETTPQQNRGCSPVAIRSPAISPANPHRPPQAGRSEGLRRRVRSTNRRLHDPSRPRPRAAGSRMTPNRSRSLSQSGSLQDPQDPLFRPPRIHLSSFEGTARLVLETQGVSRAPSSGKRPSGAPTRPPGAVGSGRERPRLSAAWSGTKGSPAGGRGSTAAGGALSSRMIPPGRVGGPKRTGGGAELPEAVSPVETLEPLTGRVGGS